MASNNHEHNDAIDRAIREQVVRYTAPLELKKRIQRGLNEENLSTNQKDSRGVLLNWQRFLFPLSLAFMLGFGLNTLLQGIYREKSNRLELDEAIIDTHIRSLQVAHLEDIHSTDQHTVKPWFSGKLDFSPPVKDWAEKGYVLSGGRLDYIDGRSVAAIIYRYKQHPINLFVWPEPTMSEQRLALDHFQLKGFNLFDWKTEGMHYVVVSDLNKQELEYFTALLRGR
jgi:anti-sigma factor RsiW